MENFTEEEKAHLIAFKNNLPMFEAVQKALLACIYENGVIKAGAKHDPKQNWALAVLWNSDRELSDTELANSIRATAEGVRFIESGLQRINNLHVDKPIAKKENKAL